MLQLRLQSASKAEEVVDGCQNERQGVPENQRNSLRFPYRAPTKYTNNTYFGS